MLVEVGSLPVLKILSNAAAIIAEGEVMQLAAAKNTSTTEDEYLAIINAKTAALFSGAAECGAAIANRPAPEQAALRSYGRNLGFAFQLIDDALDYAGDSDRMGKAIGDDFREGKITLPVILSFRRGTDVERSFWRRTIVDGEIEPGDLEHAISPHETPPGARYHARTRLLLRHDRARCAGDFPAVRAEVGHGAGDHFLCRTDDVSCAPTGVLPRHAVAA